MSTELFGGNINMKLLQINTTCGCGSIDRIAVDIHKTIKTAPLYKRMKEKGMDVKVIASTQHREMLN